MYSISKKRYKKMYLFIESLRQKNRETLRQKNRVFSALNENCFAFPCVKNKSRTTKRINLILYYSMTPNYSFFWCRGLASEDT